MLKSFSIFRTKGTHLLEKKMFEKNKDSPLSMFWFFEHAKTFSNFLKL
jgi:hypothetical protein